MGYRMYSELFPRDPLAAAALIALVMDDIHERGPRDREHLLVEFLRTAWPTQASQDQ